MGAYKRHTIGRFEREYIQASHDRAILGEKGVRPARPTPISTPVMSPSILIESGLHIGRVFISIMPISQPNPMFDDLLETSYPIFDRLLE